MEAEILETLNKAIRNEKGNRVTIDSKWTDAEVDSFGTVMIMMELDSKYGIFKNVLDGEDQFKGINFEELTIRELVQKCMY